MNSPAETGFEVVLVGSASLESLRQTHSSYFGASGPIGPMLTGSR